LGLGHFDPGIFLDTPVGKTINRITLSWNWSEAAPLGFHLERTNSDFSKTPLDAPDVAGVEDYQVALATFRAACERWPGTPITLRQGARVIEDSRRLRLVWPEQ
jgi:hypothetical protein